jgi:anti-sigma factor RsiW
MASLHTRLEHRFARRRMSDYVDGDRSAAQRRRLERHADLCPECGPLRRALMWLVVELRELRRPPDRSIVPDVVDHLRAAEAEGRRMGGGLS